MRKSPNKTYSTMGMDGGAVGAIKLVSEHVQKQKSAYNEIKTWTLQAKKFRQPSRGR